MKKVVAVSGGFDPLHIGHLLMLKDAKELGDELVVILNSDRFLIEKKGYCFMPFQDRKEILEAIRYVDRVVPCIDEDQTVRETLEVIHPDIFANGGDRRENSMPPVEKEVCDKLKIQMVYGVGGGKSESSSDLVERVCEDFWKPPIKEI